MKTLEVTVRPDGKTTIETRGFVGNECRQASESLEDALGQRTSEKLTAEFHQVSTSQQQTERN